MITVIFEAEFNATRNVDSMHFNTASVQRRKLAGKTPSAASIVEWACSYLQR